MTDGNRIGPTNVFTTEELKTDATGLIFFYLEMALIIFAYDKN